MERVITVTELRNRTRDIMEEAKYKGQRIIVKTLGKPMAAIVGVQDYQKLVELEKQEVEREKRFELLRQAAARNDMTEEEAMALAEEARQWAYENKQSSIVGRGGAGSGSLLSARGNSDATNFRVASHRRINWWNYGGSVDLCNQLITLFSLV